MVHCLRIGDKVTSLSSLPALSLRAIPRRFLFGSLTLFIVALLAAAGRLAGLFPASNEVILPPGTGDPVLRRLVQAAVHIESGDGNQACCGVLVDQENRLIVTPSESLGDQANARVYFQITGSPETVPLANRSREFEDRGGIAGHVVFRDAKRGLALIRLERLPEGATPITLGDQPPSLRQALHSLRRFKSEGPW